MARRRRSHVRRRAAVSGLTGGRSAKGHSWTAPRRGNWLTAALAGRANVACLRMTAERGAPSEVATSETHPQSPVAPEIVALMERVLLPALVNNVPIALALEIF